MVIEITWENLMQVKNFLIELTWSIVLVTGKKWCQIEETECPHTVLHGRNNDISNSRERFCVVDIEG